MNIFDNLVIPESAESLHLLNIVLSVSLILFMPYLGFINGASIFSLIFNILGQREKKEHYIQYSRELIDMAFYNRGILYSLGIIPLISILFSYIQLLHGSNTGVTEYLLFSFILLIVSIVLLSIYKYTYKLDNLVNKEILSNISNDGTVENTVDETKRFISSNLKTNKKKLTFGVALATYRVQTGSFRHEHQIEAGLAVTPARPVHMQRTHSCASTSHSLILVTPPRAGRSGPCPKRAPTTLKSRVGSPGGRTCDPSEPAPEKAAPDCACCSDCRWANQSF
jgi:hypothetical protein